MLAERVFVDCMLGGRNRSRFIRSHSSLMVGGSHNPRPGRYTRDPWAEIEGNAVGKGEAVLNRRLARRSVHWPLFGLAHTPLVTLLETRVRCRVREAVCRRASK